MPKHAVARASEIPPGSRAAFVLSGRPIVVFNVKGEYFALLNRCPHQGAPLCGGVLTGLAWAKDPTSEIHFERAGEIVRCPWHGWEYDIRTGQSYFDPAHTKVRRYEAGVADGRTLIEGPYKADTFEVSVEEEYVVVDV